MQEEIQEDYLIGDGTSNAHLPIGKRGRDISFHKPDHELGEPMVRPDSHLVKSIFALYMFPLLGIIAIYKSWQVYQKYKSADYEGAMRASETANKTANWAIGLAIIPVLLVIGYFIAYVALFA